VPRYWKVTMPGRSSNALAVARYSNNDPFFVERPYQAGRVLLCTIPLDNSWRSNLPEKLAFAPLAHELVYYLAGARAARHNVEPGQPLHFQPGGDAPPGQLVIRPPQGEAKTEQVDRWPFDFRDTRDTGVYRMQLGEHTSYFVVQPDPAESILAPATSEEREKVAKLVPIKYENDRGKLSIELVASTHRQELWLWFLIGVVVLLCGEVWLTRRIALNR
jgi:hypothetical protein